MFIKQDPMRRVTLSLIPIFLWSVYLYGWRTIVLGAVVFLLGTLSEFIFEKSRNKKVSEAVLVTCALFTLSLPPAVPLWVAAIGIIFAVVMGKEVYGGFGRNIFNPAITGRTFVYISFPLLMQTTWMLPGNFGLGGINRQALGSTWTEAIFMLLLVAALYWYVARNVENKKKVIWSLAGAVALTVAFYIISAYGGFRAVSNYEIDVITSATPIEISRNLAVNWQPKAGFEYLKDNSLVNLFFGFRIGSMGEGAIFLILLAAIYLLWTKTANWRPMLWTILSAGILTVAFYYSNVLGGTVDHPGRFPQFMVKADLAGQAHDILVFMMSGALLFGAVFMATDPVSAPKKKIPQHLYGIIIGAITILIRVFAGFPEGISFAILTANTFALLLDEALPDRKKPAPKTSASGEKPVVSAGGTE